MAKKAQPAPYSPNDEQTLYALVKLALAEHGGAVTDDLSRAIRRVWEAGPSTSTAAYLARQINAKRACEDSAREERLALERELAQITGKPRSTGTLRVVPCQPRGSRG